MSQTKLYDEWWTEPGVGDQGMEDEHLEFWEKILDEMIDQSLAGKTLLDFGCNQGGFLRHLHDRHGLKAGLGVDLAQKSVEKANQRKGDRPLRYEARTSLAGLEGQFDAATSTAVIYLVQDLEDHARQIFAALKPGGVYWASHPDYPNDPALDKVRGQIDRWGSIAMQDHTLDDIANAFAAAGFKVAIKRIRPKGYVGLPRPDGWYPSVHDRLVAEYQNSYAFKCTKPGG